MTQEASAAQEVDTSLLDPLTGQELPIDNVETPIVDSAPTVEEAQAEPVKKDGVQKRFDKLTADKYAEKRRADELAKRVQELEASKPPAATPSLEDFDFDEDAHRAALIKQEVQAAISGQTQAQRDADVLAAREVAAAKFSEGISSLNKEDFDAVASSVPLLPEGVADALMQSDNGAEVIYHLGSNLDVADRIAGMSPLAAMAEIGRISASMATQPVVKPSAAPAPIAPLKTGSSLSTDVGDDMPISEWMQKYNG